MSTNTTNEVAFQRPSWSLPYDITPVYLPHVSTQLLLAAGVLFFLSQFRRGAKVKAPFIGYRNSFEPAFIVRCRFVFDAWNMIQDGYRRYHDRLFYLSTVDTDFLVLPRKYLEELKAVSRNVISNTEAQIKTTAGEWTDLKGVLKSDLHLKALKNHITPNLSRIMSDVRDELNYAWQVDMPQPQDWIEFDIQALLRRIVARLSGRVFIGYPECRREEWVKASLDYTINLFTYAFLLRQFPVFLRKFMAPFIPSRYRTFSNVRTIQHIISPLMETYVAAAASGAQYTQPVTVLNAMIDEAIGKEKLPSEMAKRQALLTLASIHTTSTTVSHAIFDLCTHPEYIQPLTEEVDQYLATTSENNDWAKQNLVKLQKLDSFLIESMRIHIPSFLLPSRIVMKPLQLSDGTNIPVKTHIGFAAAGISRDAELFPNPDEFDGSRSYRKRQADGQAQKHLMVMPDQGHLAFGYGSQACPGRFFAVNEIKLIFARLLDDYEFKLPDGAGSPKVGAIGELPTLDAKATVMMRKRPKRTHVPDTNETPYA